MAVLGGLLALSALVFAGSYMLSSLNDCSGKERAIVEEYPHYGGRRIATYPWTFSCSIRYSTEASRKKVLSCYEKLLRQHSWEVLGELPSSAGGTLVARRDGYSYWVSYEPPSKEDPDLPDDKALVMVSANDHPPPASRFPE